jgi:hypothetical protein
MKEHTSETCTRRVSSPVPRTAARPIPHPLYLPVGRVSVVVVRCHHAHLSLSSLVVISCHQPARIMCPCIIDRYPSCAVVRHWSYVTWHWKWAEGAGVRACRVGCWRLDVVYKKLKISIS